MKAKSIIVFLAVVNVALAVLVCMLLVRVELISRDNTLVDGYVINREDKTIAQHIVAPDGMHYVNVYTDKGEGATVAPSANVLVATVGTAQRWEGKREWVLYHSYRWTDLEIQWLDNETLLIRNPYNWEGPKEIELNIYQDHVSNYDNVHTEE